ncbi:MAG: hypothetical protein LLG20_11600 [Acidobacteriales bacterium]|nr:hypothetical protein [Terriglobales bacterium]
MNEGGVTKMLTLGAVAGFVGVAATAFAAGWERFWVNWILWLLFVLTIGLGCLFIVALEHVVGAKWSVPLRRVPERLSSLTLLMGPALLIALFALPVLYPWTRPEAHNDPLIAGKAVWLNVPFFCARVAACLGLWLISYRLLVSGSIRQDRDKDFRFNVRARRFAPVFMVILGITITIVAFDWIAGLEPTWYSDVFGVYLFAGTFLAGLSAATLVVLHLFARGRLPGVQRDHIYNLGGFLFAFTVFWAYIGFAQYLLMWYANLPEEVFWYKERLEGLWGLLVLVLAVFHFFVPFIVLIPRDAKTESKRLVWVAAIMLMAHWLDLYWMVFPVLGKGPLFGWPELSFAVFFLSASAMWVRRLTARGETMPVGDPFLQEGLEFRL